MLIQYYTDGGCVLDKRIGAWAFVKVIDNKLVTVKKFGKCTNEIVTANRMEYTAAIMAIEDAIENKITSAEMYSDSSLLCDTYNKWMHNWANKGWVRKIDPKKPKEVKNLDLVKHLYELKQIGIVKQIEWVRGHNGNPYNELADQLCSDAIKNINLLSSNKPFKHNLSQNMQSHQQINML